MKKFEYRQIQCEAKDIIKECNRLGNEGWEAFSITDFHNSLTSIIYFKLEIIEQ